MLVEFLKTPASQEISHCCSLLKFDSIITKYLLVIPCSISTDLNIFPKSLSDIKDFLFWNPIIVYGYLCVM